MYNLNKYYLHAGMLMLSACHSPAPITGNCTFKHIPVTSVDVTRNEVYTGKGLSTEIQFVNENAPQPAEVFPDPKVTINNIQTGKQCTITDGAGIWVGKSVYLEKSEQVVLLKDYSGSSDTLLFYDTSTCRKLAVLDISDTRWVVSGDRIRTGKQCHGDTIEQCQQIQEYPFTAKCIIDVSNKTTGK